MGIKNNPNTKTQMEKVLQEAVILDKSGNTVSARSLSDKKYVLLYFSAHWCPPCRGFTPVLVEWYKEAKAAGHDVEVIFVSSDQNEDQWKNYWNSMPWLSVKYGDPTVQSIKQNNSVSG